MSSSLAVKLLRLNDESLRPISGVITASHASFALFLSTVPDGQGTLGITVDAERWFFEVDRNVRLRDRRGKGARRKYPPPSHQEIDAAFREMKTTVNDLPVAPSGLLERQLFDAVGRRWIVQSGHNATCLRVFLARNGIPNAKPREIVP